MDLLERVDPLRAPLVVLLSGGRDSVCLLDVAATRLGTEAVRAVHVDHGLRSGSADDAAACVALGARLGVEVVVHRAGPRGAGNLHAWARDVRYAAARALAGDAGWVATGHTATDQVETILYRLATSPGRRALLGMRPEDGRLLRPLLEVTREETAAWCAARGLAWVEDPSNDDPRFARSRVRHGLVPALRAVDARAEPNVLRTAAALREEAEALDAVVADVLGEGDGVAREALAALHPAIGRLVLRALAERVAGAPCPRAAGRLADVLALDEGGRLDLGDGARAAVDRGVVAVEATPELPRAMRAP